MEVDSLVASLGIPNTTLNRVLFGLSQALLLGATTWLWTRARKKRLEIKRPQENCPWLQTYSYLSVKMVSMVLLVMLLQMGLQFT